jgi:hypothetical protein
MDEVETETMQYVRQYVVILHEGNTKTILYGPSQPFGPFVEAGDFA